MSLKNNKQRNYEQKNAVEKIRLKIKCESKKWNQVNIKQSKGNKLRANFSISPGEEYWNDKKGILEGKGTDWKCIDYFNFFSPYFTAEFNYRARSILIIFPIPSSIY